MKKFIVILLVFSFLLVACSGEQDNISTASTVQPSQGTESGSSSDNDNSADPDYSQYSALVNAYKLDYEEIKFMDYSEDSDLKDTGGFVYANLIDLDGNGVLELILIGAEDNLTDAYTTASPFGTYNLKYPNVVDIYTLDNNNELKFAGDVPISVHQGPVSLNQAVVYSTVGDDTYLVVENNHSMFASDTTFYQLSDGLIKKTSEFTHHVEDTSDDVTFTIDGTEYTDEEYTQKKDEFGIYESYTAHPVNYLSDVYLEQLREVNQKTFDFLEDYSIENFENEYSTYNDGLFYILESTSALSESEELVHKYYKYLTTEDYSALADIFIDESHAETLKNTREGSAFSPGFIISDIEVLTYEEIAKENVLTAEFLSGYLGELSRYEDVEIVCFTSNEILDESVAPLGMQVGGGMYRNCYIMVSDNGQWKIEAMLNDKFDNEKDAFRAANIGTSADFSNFDIPLDGATANAIENYIHSSADAPTAITISADSTPSDADYFLIKLNNLLSVEKLEIYSVETDSSGVTTRDTVIYNHDDIIHHLLLEVDRQFTSEPNIEIVVTCSSGAQFGYYPIMDEFRSYAILNDYSSYLPMLP